RFSHEIRFAELESSDVRRFARSTSSQHQRNFVDSENGDRDRSVLIRKCEHCRVGEIRLCAKNTFRFGAFDLRASLARLQPEKSLDDFRIGRRMQRGDLSRESLLYLRPADLEWWTRVHFYAAHDLALAGNGQRFQTLSRKHNWASDRQPNHQTD